MTPLKQMLIRHEDDRLKPYKDTHGKITIGVGRNLTDRGISRPESMMLLENDIFSIENRFYAERYRWIRCLDSVRRDVVTNMIFNMGMRKFLGFKLAIKAMKARKWKEAENQMRYPNGVKSLWHKQVKGRARELGIMMRTGKYR